MYLETLIIAATSGYIVGKLLSAGKTKAKSHPAKREEHKAGISSPIVDLHKKDNNVFEIGNIYSDILNKNPINPFATNIRTEDSFMKSKNSVYEQYLPSKPVENKWLDFPIPGWQRIQIPDQPGSSFKLKYCDEKRLFKVKAKIKKDGTVKYKIKGRDRR